MPDRRLLAPPGSGAVGGPSVLNPGDEIDIWVVERALGQGGMGSVYRCHNREARRILAAIKVLDPSVSRVPSAKARFVREAEILFRLDHPGIVKVRNVRMEIDTPYLEMEFVDGVGLNERIGDGPTPVDQPRRGQSRASRAGAPGGPRTRRSKVGILLSLQARSRNKACLRTLRRQ